MYLERLIGDFEEDRQECLQQYKVGLLARVLAAHIIKEFQKFHIEETLLLLRQLLQTVYHLHLVLHPIILVRPRKSN